MGTENTRARIELFYKLLVNKDNEAIIELLAEDVEWDTPGDEQLAPWAGKKRGKEEVRAYFEVHDKWIEGLIFDINLLLIDKQNAIATGYLSSRMLKTGKVYNSHFFTHFVLSDNKITKYLFSEDSWRLVSALSENQTI